MFSIGQKRGDKIGAIEQCYKIDNKAMIFCAGALVYLSAKKATSLQGTWATERFSTDQVQDTCELLDNSYSYMSDNNSEDAEQMLASQIIILRQKLKNQEQLLSGTSKWSGDQLYSQYAQLEKMKGDLFVQRSERLRQHYKYRDACQLQTQGDAYLQQKLKKKIGNLIHDIDSILYSRTSKSSFSASSSNSNSGIYHDDFEVSKERIQFQEQQLLLKQIQEINRMINQLI